MTLLKVEHLAKRYGDRDVVQDVSLEVESGQIVGLLGPNGAGKTTTFYMIVGLIQCDKGRIYIDNNDVSSDPMYLRARKGIGYLPQELSIFRKLSVRDNIMSVLQLRKDLTKSGKEEVLDSLLEEFRIPHLISSLGISLSGGEQRRVEIARTLAANPKFILLDEPFAGVDPISVAEIKEIIIQLKEKDIGILITDHSVRETLDVCEHAYIVSHGHLIASGTPREVIDNEEVRAVYLGEQFKL